MTPKHTIVDRQATAFEEAPTGYREMMGMPNLLVHAIVSPFRDGPLADAKNRRWLAREFQIWIDSHPTPSTQLLKATSFYRANPLDAESDGNITPPNPSIFVRPLEVVINDALEPALQDSIREMLDDVLVRRGIAVHAFLLDKKDPNWVQKCTSNRSYDLRFGRVDTGGNAENWVVRMMFCSTLGVSIPDPAGKMCQLTSDFEDDSKSISLDDYLRRFNAVVSEDATVIPLFHTGRKWWISDDIDVGDISATMWVPRFDKLQID